MTYPFSNLIPFIPEGGSVTYPSDSLKKNIGKNFFPESNEVPDVFTYRRNFPTSTIRLGGKEMALNPKANPGYTIYPDGYDPYPSLEQQLEAVAPMYSNPTSRNPQPTQSQENPPSTPQPALRQPEQDANQHINSVTLNGMQNQPSQPDSFELARLASGNINDDNLAYVNEIIAAKNAWNQSTTEADKKAAADYATYIRNLAQMNDVDLGQFGDANTLSGEQANLALGKYVLDEQLKAQKKFQSVQDNLANNYSESSNDHFWRLYDEYRQQGDSDRIAAIKAGRETTGYQQERVQSLQSAIDDYGIEGGVMNQFGVSLLGQLADEDNIMGSAYANAYATPKLNYEKQQAMAQEILKQNSANQRKLAEMQAQRENLVFTEGKKDNRLVFSEGKKDERKNKELSHQNYQNDKKYNFEIRMEKFRQSETNKRFYDKLKSEEERAKADRLTKLYLAEIKKNNPNGKKKEQFELEKQYSDVVAKYEKYAEEHPDSYNPYEDAVKEARRLKDHVFEADPNTEQGIWSWITDVLSENIEDTGQKMTYDELVDFFRKKFPNNPYVEGALKTIKDQKNEFVNWR